VTIAVLALGYLAILRNWGTILLVIASLAGGTLLNSVLKGAFGRPRPELVAHLVTVETASLPSGHAMMSAVTYLTLGALLARVQPWWPLKMYIMGAAVVLTLLVGFSRVYLGVHWPTDVLAGWSIGAAWAMACCLLARSAMRQAAAPETLEG
jgi:undecaprenyl-diphosphatase